MTQRKEDFVHRVANQPALSTPDYILVMPAARNLVFSLLLVGSTWAVPLRRSLGEVDVSPHGPHIEPSTGLPECDMITGPDAPAGTENMLDAFSGLGACQIVVDSGQYTCEHDMCPHCEHNQYCDGLCGFCTHDDAELPEPWQHAAGRSPHQSQ